jgi:hypothetical protein
MIRETLSGSTIDVHKASRTDDLAQLLDNHFLSPLFFSALQRKAYLLTSSAGT